MMTKTGLAMEIALVEVLNHETKKLISDSRAAGYVHPTSRDPLNWRT